MTTPKTSTTHKNANQDEQEQLEEDTDTDGEDVEDKEGEPEGESDDLATDLMDMADAGGDKLQVPDFSKGEEEGGDKDQGQKSATDLSNRAKAVANRWIRSARVKIKSLPEFACR
jgi:hypothetical protein